MAQFELAQTRAQRKTNDRGASASQECLWLPVKLVLAPNDKRSQGAAAFASRFWKYRGEPCKPALMKVVYSVDVARLESMVVDAVASRPHGGLVDSILVLAPTTALVDALKVRILEATRAVVGAHIMTFHRLCERAMEVALEPPPTVLPAAAERALLRRLLPQSPLSGASGQSPSAASSSAPLRKPFLEALRTTLRDLREAKISAAELTGVQGKTGLVGTYRAFEATLQRLESLGVSDYAGLVRKAAPHVGNFLTQKRIVRVIQYGAYDLTEINVELLRSIDACVEVEFYLPTEIDGPAYALAQDFTRRLETLGASISSASFGRGSRVQSWRRSLGSLFDDGDDRDATQRQKRTRREASGEAGNAAPVTLDDLLTRGGPALELRHSQGNLLELEAAVLRALSLHVKEDVAWHEIAIVARSLEPYAPFLNQLCTQHGVPYTTSARETLKRRGAVAAFLTLLRLLSGDFERAVVIEVLRSPFVDSGASGGALQVTEADIDRVDRLSRATRLVRGAAAWSELPALVATNAAKESTARQDDVAAAQSVAALVEDLAADATEWAAAATLDAQCAAIKDIAARWISPQWQGDLVDVFAQLDAVRLTVISGEGRNHGPELQSAERHDHHDIGESEGASESPCSPVEMLSLLSEIADEKLDRQGARAEAGVHILDLMQLRGMTHEVVIWLGFHTGSFPRLARQDAFLPDSARQNIRTKTHRRLRLARESDDEERLLLATTLSGARRRLVVSYQRADDAGRKRTRSSAMREIARLFIGKPDSVRLLEDAPSNPYRPERVPVHVGERVGRFARSSNFALLNPAAALAGAAAVVDSPCDEVDELAADLTPWLDLDSTRLRTAIEWVRRVERFQPHQESAALDALTEQGVGEEAEMSPTALERLGRCPQAFFLEHVLGIHRLDDEPKAYRIDHRLLGSAVHDTLEALYDDLQRRGWPRERAVPVSDVVAQATNALPALWEQNLRRYSGPSLWRLRGLRAILQKAWLQALQSFVEVDLAALCRDNIDALELEAVCRGTIELNTTTRLRVRGRLDRLARTTAGFSITDYKTSGDLGARAASAKILRGVHLQLPLYRELIASLRQTDVEGVSAQLLGVGPDFDRGKSRRAHLKWDASLRRGFLDTVSALVDLARRGYFPLQPDTDSCRYCSFRRTCRKDHAPTRERLRSHPDLQNFFALQLKSPAKPTLEDVRRAERRVEAQPTA